MTPTDISADSPTQPKATRKPDAEIEVLPNTGHHYFFVPLSKETIQKLGGKYSVFGQKCRNNDFPWGPCYRAGDSKETPTPVRWIRHRPGVIGRTTRETGVWFAIETNLGDEKRGTIFEDETPVAPGNVSRISELQSEERFPYRAESIGMIETDRNGVDRIEIKLGEKGESLIVDIIWKVTYTYPTDVDLIIDYGNTRTVVLGLEENEDQTQANGLSAVCHTISILPRGIDYGQREPSENESTLERARNQMLNVDPIFDSWFMLQEPQFAGWDYPSHDDTLSLFETSREYRDKELKVPYRIGSLSLFNMKVTSHTCITRLPQMFVEISPALMGEEARELYTGVDLSNGDNICMSSPKRYLWDREPQGERSGSALWGLKRNPWNHTPRNTQEVLRGLICRYMYEDGRFWEIEHPPYANPDLSLRPHYNPQRPTYPRSSAMVWTALGIIENAYRQITSNDWRKDNNPHSPRRLRNIHVTYPSGWIAQEKQYYREAWQQAINIFTLAHTPSSEIDGKVHYPERPDLHMELDEAVASQLPFVYSEIRRLGQANLWLQLYGRRTNHTPCPPNEEYLHWRTRIMTIDIGGGTMDSTIVEYSNTVPGASTDLCYRVLFRDSNSHAGDAVTEGIIKHVLLPSILEKKGVVNTEAKAFANILARPRKNARDCDTWKRITSHFFLPVVRQWMGDVVSNRDSGGIFREKDGTNYRTLRNCGVEERVLSEDFNAKVGWHRNPLREDERLEYDPKRIDECILNELRMGLEPLAKFVATYDVDIITLSGKISEMPIVSRMLCEFLPILPQRIVRMKDFPAGEWYPLSEDGHSINDAKTVTAVGAAIYAATPQGLMGSGWNIRPDDHPVQESSSRNFWGIMGSGREFDKDNILLTAEENTNCHHRCPLDDGREIEGNLTRIGSFIGRQKYYSEGSRGSAEQQYEICWTGTRKDPAPVGPIAITVQRKEWNPEAPCEDDIELVSAEFISPHDRHCNTENIKLRLNTLPADGFWMETGRFDLDLEQDLPITKERNSPLLDRLSCF